ncbi:MAG: hypothetical protein AAGD06_22775 [Acidobacteriota bacterium]
MTKLLNRYAIDPRDVISDVDLFREIAEATLDLTEDLRDDGPPTITGVFDWDEEFVTSIVEEALAKVNDALELSERRAATGDELSDAGRSLRSYVTELLEAPRFDPDLIRYNNVELSPSLQLVDGQLFAVERGIVSASMVGLARGGARDEVAVAAFYVDLLIEVVGLITSMIGLRLNIPRGARKRLKVTIRKFLRTPGGRRAFGRLLRAIKNRDWELFFRIIHGTEFATLITEFFAHMFADMSWKDYFVTLLKFLAFIAICAASGGAALAAKLAAVGLDLLGLGLKVKHAYEHGIQ